MSNEPLTLKEINEALGKVEPTIVYVNQKTHDSVLKLLDFKPCNLGINNYLPDNQALVINTNTEGYKWKN